ncbi:subtilisin-like protease SBT2.5 [Physcomitrium patens]|uniref:Peptidase S8/S53 domain-containing protein n=1 Tax=Physcomitrium patens TaxID=3218 RepID=A0A2K1L0B0_PHYPA|nr:subtilisin-like protease SBT2.5 [Physcomitrium patens]XP_024362590.1 subtilisin-like protease SBT2.5 [Physcomitrium patens]XP_024362599.1 subtilisin-like protease SBT2.5 [Physcomitrium patens]PNR59460.1 hypothetical protein PHYPA_002251 [Physcomitrium patens]|eukprot:XP_024362579.1 subtilisin-like protease SBT2.5 [Physcomitrella patens]
MRASEVARGWRMQTVWTVLVVALWLPSLITSEAKSYEATEAGPKKDVYMVVFDQMPIVTYNGKILGLRGTSKYFSERWRKAHKRAHISDLVKKYNAYLVKHQDQILTEFFGYEDCEKVYRYTHLVNGVALFLTADEAERLAKHPRVVRVQKSYKVFKSTVHTPEYLGLPKGVWSQCGGPTGAGEGMIIGIVDTGIDPTHPSFTARGQKPYGPLRKFRGRCDVGPGFPRGSCNGKIIGARFFNAAAKKGGFNASLHFASPLDGDGHGTHTASTAAGNHGVPVIVNGANYGSASGVAPRARLAVYKALFRFIGGFIPDVIAACDQAVADGVDILSLSLGPNSPPGGSSSTFLNVLDIALLNAVKANVLVVQAAGNGGPYAKTVTSFSPWVLSVAAGVDDRTFRNTITLGNRQIIKGTGLAPATRGAGLYPLILAQDAVQGSGDPSLSPSDCQSPKLYNKLLVRGKILICTYSFDYVYGGSTMQQLVKTVQSLEAAGVALVVDSDVSGGKYEPIPLAVPAIVFPTSADSNTLLAYYNRYTKKDRSGKILTFGATAKIGNGLTVTYTRSVQQVALFSSRGPNVKDFNFNEADILKPNVMAPGYLIWGAWTPIGTDNPAFTGQRFAMISGTSMATPHVAGLAAMLKWKYPKWSPAALASAMTTTADVEDRFKRPLLAQNPSPDAYPLLEKATPFDMGGGALNINAAMNPGLIFEAGYLNYVRFLCSMSTPREVLGATKTACAGVAGKPTDLNIPSITFANLVGTAHVPRTVTNVAPIAEKYTISITNAPDFVITANPAVFTIGVGVRNKQTILFTVRATKASQASSFARITFTGSLGHVIRVPVSVVNKRLR